MRAFVHDLETHNVPWFGNIASPYCPDNYVVMDAYETVSLSDWRAGKRTERRYKDRDAFLGTWKGHIPEDVQIYVAHNAAYEMSWHLEHNWDNFLAFLKRGGRVYCTAYAHYLLSNCQDTYPALNDVAPLYGGTQKVDGVKALWEAGVLTADIDAELLSEYLTGPGGDIANTTAVFKGTWQQLQARGMLNMALVRMDGLLFSSFCMHFGLLTDSELAKVHQSEGEARLKGLYSQVETYLPKDMPEIAREQYRGTRFQLSAFIFGGPMKYKARVPREDADGNPIYVKKEGPFFKVGKNTYVLPEDVCVFDEEAGGLWYDPQGKVQQARYTAGKNKGEPKFDKYTTTEVDTKWGELIYKFPGLLDEYTRNKLDEAIGKEWSGKQTLADGSPVISTAGDVLDILEAHNVPGSKALLDIAKIEKDIGSFYLHVEYNEDGSVKKTTGMLQYVQPDGFIHHSLNHTSTVTARLSSNKPNLQQLPRAEEAKENEFKSRVKELFISRFGADGGILQEDYSALETVGLQVFTRDENLKRALLENLDMHSMRLASMEEIPYEYVVERTKNKKHPEHDEWDIKRTGIKPVAFQYQYGATAYGMAMSTGKTQEFCQAFIDAEKRAFPQVEHWFEWSVFATVEATSRKLKPLRLELDDGRYLMIGIGTFTAPDGTTWQFQQYTKTRWNPVSRKHEELKEFKVPQMRNYPIQGGSGFFVQLACGMLIRHLIARDFYDMKCLPINTVHDATYFDSHKDVVYQAAYEIEAVMECIPEVLNKLWPDYNVEVPFPVAGGFGPNMAVEEDVYADTDEAKAEFKQKKSDFKRSYLATKGLTPLFA